MKKELKFDELMAKLKEQDDESKAFFGEAEMVADVVNELIEARVKKGWTQRDLAQKTGLKQPAIARFESLDSIPVLDTVAKIALSLGVKLTVQEPVKPIVYIYRNATGFTTTQIEYETSPKTVISNNCDAKNLECCN